MRHLLLVVLVLLSTVCALAQTPTPSTNPAPATAAPVPPRPRAQTVAPLDHSGAVAPAQCPTRALTMACPAEELICNMGPKKREPGLPEFTQEQTEKVRLIQQDYRTKLTEANAKMKSATWNLISAAASQSEGARLQDLMAAASKADVENMKLRLNYWLEIRKTLTSEQDKQVSAWMQSKLMPVLTDTQNGYGGGSYVVGY